MERYEHAVRTEVRVGNAMDDIDAAAEVTQFCFDVECHLIDYTRFKAGADPEKMLLGMHRAQGIVERDDVRLYRKGF